MTTIDEGIMKENQIADKIRESIKASKYNIVEIQIQTFINLWFQGKQFSDNGFTKKLIDFTRSYDFEYVLILNRQKIAIAIRFWEKGSQIELKGE